jgi:hypothetical protein
VKEAKIQSNSAIFCEIIDPTIDPNEKWMQIFLKTPTGRVLEMMVQKKMTIMELKRKIGKDSEIPFDQQRVIFAGPSTLED